MTITFKDLQIGDRARIISLDQLPGQYRKKLMSLGVTPGTEVELVRRAPLGDPIEIKVRGFNMSLRKTEAGSMSVEKL